jgi:hypothetical protein
MQPDTDIPWERRPIGLLEGSLFGATAAMVGAMAAGPVAGILLHVVVGAFIGRWNAGWPGAFIGACCGGIVGVLGEALEPWLATVAINLIAVGLLLAWFARVVHRSWAEGLARAATPAGNPARGIS